MHNEDAYDWVLLPLLFIIVATMYFYAHWQGVGLPSKHGISGCVTANFAYYLARQYQLGFKT